MNSPSFALATLTGEAVVLEPLAERHWPGILAVGLAPELWTWTIDGVTGESDLRRWFDDALAAAAAGRAVPFATILRASGRVVGSTRFGHLDARNRRVEIGWTWVAPTWQRTGVNAEAKYLMLRHAFEALGCLRVEFKTDRLNEKSRRALERIGAVEEGIFRNHMVMPDGRMRDSVYYSIVDREWPAVKTTLEGFLAR
jgi:RimJ/RimL family protein N-acetyltransferase